MSTPLQRADRVSRRKAANASSLDSSPGGKVDRILIVRSHRPDRETVLVLSEEVLTVALQNGEVVVRCTVVHARRIAHAGE
jgi:hypothetical protein